MTDQMRKRIAEGRKLLARLDQADPSGDGNEWAERRVELAEYLGEEARFFLHDLPQRIAELEEALTAWTER